MQWTTLAPMLAGLTFCVASSTVKAQSLPPNTRVRERSGTAAPAWLARQQHEDGSWDFRDGKDREKVEDGDAADAKALRWRSKTGATGLVLLSFLAAGQTHQNKGPYGKTVAAGLDFLMRHADAHTQKPQSGATTANLCGEGDALIWHAIAVTALCLRQHGPTTNDLIFNYFGTNCLHNAPGPDWDRWTRANRKMLIELQTKEGPEAGSWWLPDELHAASGGRLFQTAMIARILTIYYGPLPLYRADAAEGNP